MRRLLVIALAATVLLASCSWRDAEGVEWHGQTEQEAMDENENIYWAGAYGVCMLHNLRILKARGANVETPAVFNLADATCVRAANEALQFIGPDGWPWPRMIPAMPAPISTPCVGCM